MLSLHISQIKLVIRNVTFIIIVMREYYFKTHVGRQSLSTQWENDCVSHRQTDVDLRFQQIHRYYTNHVHCQSLISLPEPNRNSLPLQK